MLSLKYSQTQEYSQTQAMWARPATGHCMAWGGDHIGAGEDLTSVLPAGLVKSELEAQTGLQILQTGVGQV